MTTTTSFHSLAQPFGSSAKRAARVGSRADMFNRLYIMAMFAVIIATGGFGIFALAQSELDGVLVARSFEHANDATEMGTAMDRENAALIELMRKGRSGSPATLVWATRMFDGAYAEVQRDGWVGDDGLVKALGSRHAAFLSQSLAISAAVERGDDASAKRIERDQVRPVVSAVRRMLDVISAESFRASVALQEQDSRSMRNLKNLIIGITLLGVGLMAGFAMLLRRYKRAARRSASATLAALESAATTDNLTKLGNNRSFYDDFEREIARAKRHDHSLVLALIDVDDFKAVNDKGGHSHGDAVLEALGERFRSLRQEDRAYRIGGDEFALILVETDPDGAALALGRLQAEIRQADLGATVSIGYANLSGEQLSAESYELADTALYEAKRLGRNQTVCFKSISDTVNVYSPRKADAVRRMIAKGLVTTAFQPIWDMQSTRPLGFEALARPLAELELSGPQEAFDVAQRIRQLPALDKLCTKKALETAGNLPAGSVVFLNYSPASLTHSDFDPQALVDMARAAGFEPGQIVIELTERRIDDPSMVAQRAAALKAVGIRIALDDTGSGHAGLEILSKVRFDFVKIDRMLIVDAMQNREARGVLAGILAIARETGSYLIAEGIETEEMLSFIRSVHVPKAGQFAGVRGIQGYLLGRPEIGQIDLRSLEEHHNILAASQRENPVPACTVEVISGEQSGSERVAVAARRETA